MIPRPLADALPPALALAAGGLLWEAGVRATGVAPYLLPAPSLVAATLARDWPVLGPSLLVTLRTTLAALALAALGGGGLAVLLSLSRPAERALYPYAVVLQVTPVVAVAPLLLVYLPAEAAVLTCAWLVAFFPVLANTLAGLRAVDPGLLDLFAIHARGGTDRRGSPGAPRPAREGPLPQGLRLPRGLRLIWILRLPTALPGFLAGLRIAGGLSLVGAVVAEIALGSAGAGSGLAYRILESQYRLNIPRLFAALVLLAALGVAIHLALLALERIVLRRTGRPPREEGEREGEREGARHRSFTGPR